MKARIRKIGEIFEHKGEWHQCVKQPNDYIGCVCNICSMKGFGNCELDLCSETYRKDKTNVVFKKLEKVGEPVTINGILVQKMKTPLAIGCLQYALNNNGCSVHYEKCLSNELYVEIKQNQEDMEEKKLNLKEFDLENAKAGMPVCTRDGRKARIICFDAEGNKPLIILSKINGQEVILRYTEKGQSDNFHSPTPREDDLMMLPEKHEGWVNIVKCGSDRSIGSLYPTKEDALKHIYVKDKDYIDTVRISWEE